VRVRENGTAGERLICPSSDRPGGGPRTTPLFLFRCRVSGEKFHSPVPHLGTFFGERQSASVRSEVSGPRRMGCASVSEPLNSTWQE
jgi:hypothetical protein